MSNLIFALITILFLGVTESPRCQVDKDSVSLQKSITLSWGYGDSASYYESQIRIADSLYKNYLPQYNFEEVKAAMKFFDSLRLSKTTDNGQQTTDIFHRIFPNKRQRTMCTVPEPVEGTTRFDKLSDLDLGFQEFGVYRN